MSWCLEQNLAVTCRQKKSDIGEDRCFLLLMARRGRKPKISRLNSTLPATHGTANEKVGFCSGYARCI